MGQQLYLANMKMGQTQLKSYFSMCTTQSIWRGGQAGLVSRLGGLAGWESRVGGWPGGMVTWWGSLSKQGGQRAMDLQSKEFSGANVEV